MKLVDSWKLDSVYDELAKSNLFVPTIVIAPLIASNRQKKQADITRCIDYCKRKGYNYIKAYNEDTLEVINLKKIIDPDIIFFTGPHNSSGDSLYIKNYLSKLTCYIPYSFRISKDVNYDFNNELVNLTWINFYESSTHKLLAEKHAQNKGTNVVDLGFPLIDTLKQTHKQARADQRKQIIWAPHWTIKGVQQTGLDWACFLNHAEFILELAIKYKDDICLAMKPHPLLYATLEKEEVWGKDRTTAYFKRWTTLENCRIVNGDYKQLFADADAIIHDSGSFMTEFLIFDKPMAYTVNDTPLEGRFNEFGNIILEAHELIYSNIELEEFIVSTIDSKDNLKAKRKEIVQQTNLLPEISIGENIVRYISQELT